MSQAEVIAELMDQQLNGLSDQQKKFEDAAAKQAQQVGTMRDELIEAMTKRQQKKQYPPEVVAIAAALMLQPRLIPPVGRFIQEKMAAIDAFVADLFGESTPEDGE